MHDIPHPWERLLWDARPRRASARLRGVHYYLTDVRLVRADRRRIDEVPIHDIGDVHRIETVVDRFAGTSTLVIDAKRTSTPSLVLAGVVRGAQVAALIEWLAGRPNSADVDIEALQRALDWDPSQSKSRGGNAALAVAGGAAVLFASAIALHGSPRPVQYSAFDPIAPNGVKRGRAEIVRYMEIAVMPWARAVLGPLKGGPDRVSCETCHGSRAADRGWRMPAVAALPAPDLRDLGWERYSDGMDAQVRNAIYGYLAEADKQARATYMREVVMPGMARLLNRPAYDFTRPYAENRARNALGCYHCHRVGSRE